MAAGLDCFKCSINWEGAGLVDHLGSYKVERPDRGYQLVIYPALLARHQVKGHKRFMWQVVTGAGSYG